MSRTRAILSDAVEAKPVTLPTAAKGMAGVFAVILAAWASIAILVKVFGRSTELEKALAFGKLDYFEPSA